ncbi:patatin-like phospholipase family protein [Kordiimonas lipolytica]|uniref:Patatin-like phospholipase family protein n=1 Tax=Kordiimonas lipolytica TaxID=1662421 RepID=A0ABV8UA12_9PROT|nr:patatin-like phospholipase family protein [Kordiimonas lipolytica]
MASFKRALVLSGGNVKGAYQAGAIKALLNHTFADGSMFTPEAIYGVSVGSMNGGFMADRAGAAVLAGKQPDWPEIGNEIEAFWRDNVTSFASIGKKRGTLELVGDVLFGKFDGLTTMDGAADLARENIRPDNLRASPAYYACGVTNMATGDFFEASVETFGDDVIDYVIASTREPVAMPLMWINDMPMADGGIRNIAPLKPAIKRGAEQMAVIAMKPEQMTPDYARKNFRNILKLLKRTIGTLTSEIMNNDLNEVRKINHACKIGGQAIAAGKRIIEFVEIRPEDRLPIDVTDFDSKDIQALIKMGEEEAKKQLDKGWLTGDD